MSRGHDRERAVQDLLQGEDWWVGRIAGSLGDVDLVAARAWRADTPLVRNPETRLQLRRLLFVEVKSTAGGPYERFGPKARADLSFAARLAGAEAWLVHWPPRKQPEWIPASHWPSQRPPESADRMETNT